MSFVIDRKLRGPAERFLHTASCLETLGETPSDQQMWNFRPSTIYGAPKNTISKMLNLDNIREDFQQRADRIYFNAGLVGFPAKSVWQHTLNFYSRFQYQSETSYFQVLEELNALWQQTAPAFISCQPQEITGIPNTTTGMNLITRAIPWRRGSNVVICDLEFVSEYLAFQHFREHYGFEIRVAKRDGWGVPAENVLAQIDERTQLVALSHVAFVNGYRHDIRKIAAAAHAHGALVAVDAIQSLGPLAVDVRQLDVDFLAAGSSKWLMALPGWGVMYVREAILGEFHSPVAGFLSIDKPAEAIQDWRDGFDFVKPYPITRERIDKFRCSTENLLAKICLAYAMQNFMHIGREAIEQHIVDLSGYLMDRLEERGHRLQSVPDRAHRSGIVNFRPRRPVSNLQQKLETERIFTSQRGGGIRISLHLYNTREEVDRFMQTLERSCA